MDMAKRWVLSWAAGCTGGVVLFLALCLRHRHAKLEVIFLRSLLQASRFLLGVGLALTAPLWYVAGSGITPVATPLLAYGNPKNGSFEHGYGRPIAQMLLLGAALRLEMHAALRWLACLGLAGILTIDAISNYGVDDQLACVEAGRCSLQSGTSIGGLRLLSFRDLAAMATAACALVPVSFLLLALGPRANRIAPARFETGPYNRLNAMRLELRKLGAWSGRKPAQRREDSFDATAGARGGIRRSGIGSGANGGRGSDSSSDGIGGGAGGSGTGRRNSGSGSYGKQ
ncbi:unnamed protein product [Phaeothamnion confervicola]